MPTLHSNNPVPSNGSVATVIRGVKSISMTLSGVGAVRAVVQIMAHEDGAAPGPIGNQIVVSGTTTVTTTQTFNAEAGQVYLQLVDITPACKFSATLTELGPIQDTNPGSPSSPFTTTDQRTAWATANLAALRSGVSTVWGPGNVEYVWPGPGVKDWRLVSSKPSVAENTPRVSFNTGALTCTSIDTRKAHILARSCATIRLYYRNLGPNGISFNEIQDASGLGDADVNASIELDGKNIPVTFGGKRLGQLQKSGFLVSDPIYIGRRAKGYVFYSRSRAALSSGKIAVNLAGYRAYEGYALNGSDLTGGTGISGYTASNGNSLFSPFAILTDDAPETEKTTLFLGDSIIYGAGDLGYTPDQYPPNSESPALWGWAKRCSNTRFPAWVAGYPGGTCAQFSAAASPLFHTELASYRFDRAVLAFGANDCLSESFASIKSAFQSAIVKLRNFGIPSIYIALILPRTTSTDAWATEVNQTPMTGFGVGGTRDQLNAWFLAGADGTIEGTIDTLTGVANGAAWLPSRTTDGAHPKGNNTNPGVAYDAHYRISENAKLVLVP